MEGADMNALEELWRDWRTEAAYIESEAEFNQQEFITWLEEGNDTTSTGQKTDKELHSSSS